MPSDAPYSDEDRPQGERNHAAQITRADSDIGRILARLDERGLADDTLILVTSDNGPHEEGANYGHVGSRLPHDPEFFDSFGPLRGIKRDVYEGSIRVPMLARLPRHRRSGGPRPGSVVREPVAVWDVLPTLTELAGVARSGGLDGVSFLPSLTGGRQPEREYLYWEHREGGYDQAVRFGKWKAVRLDGGSTQLYDVHRDWQERADLAAERPELVATAERLMAEAVTPLAAA